MRKNIIWIASYPKSGSTWIRSIIVNILYSKNYNFNFELLRNIIEFDIPKNYNFLLPKNIDEFNNLNKIETLSKFWIKAQSNYNLLGDKKIFKTHSANISFQGNHYTIPETTRGLIYVLRDPRDVLISAYYWFGFNARSGAFILNDHNGFIEFLKKKEGAKIKIMLPNYVN